MVPGVHCVFLFRPEAERLRCKIAFDNTVELVNSPADGIVAERYRPGNERTETR